MSVPVLSKFVNNPMQFVLDPNSVFVNTRIATRPKFEIAYNLKIRSFYSAYTSPKMSWYFVNSVNLDLMDTLCPLDIQTGKRHDSCLPAFDFDANNNPSMIH